MAQDDYIRTALRVPPDLHKALHAAADESGKSFNAEIIGRLQASFQNFETADSALKREFEAQLGRLISRRDSVEMRTELARTRLDSLDVRRRMIVSELERMPANEGGVEKLAKMQEGATQLNAVQKELSMLRDELESLLQARNEVLQEISNLQGRIAAVRVEAEIRLRKAKS